MLIGEKAPSGLERTANRCLIQLVAEATKTGGSGGPEAQQVGALERSGRGHREVVVVPRDKPGTKGDLQIPSETMGRGKR